MAVVRVPKGTMRRQYLEDFKRFWGSKISEFPEPEKFYEKDLQDEPPSALFAEWVETEIIAVENPRDPIGWSIVSKVVIKFNEQAEQMITKMDQARMPWREFLRSGGTYSMAIATKRVEKWDAYPELIETGRDMIQSAYWKGQETDITGAPIHVEEGQPIFQASGRRAKDALLDWGETRTEANMQICRVHPDKAVGNKPESTGTGYTFPLQTRGDMAKNFPAQFERVRSQVKEWYAGFREAWDIYLETGDDVIIELGTPGLMKNSAWSPMSGGRSDVDVVEMVKNDDGTWTQVHRAKTREVGNVPSAPFHNKALDPPTDTQALVESVLTEYSVAPDDMEFFIEIATTTPATMPGDDPEEPVWINADVGIVQNPARVQHMTLILVDHGGTTGADQIVMNGMYVRSNAKPGKLLPLMTSGMEGTMWWHEVWWRHYIAGWARSMGIMPTDLRMYVVGDDTHIWIRRKWLQAFVDAMGHILKLKGMHVIEDEKGRIHAGFLTGHFICRYEDDKDKFSWAIVPRGKKTVSSAKRLKQGQQRSGLKFGDIYRDDVDLEAKEQADQLWDLYPENILFIGTVQEFKEWAERHLLHAMLEFATDAGVAEWFAELLPEGATANAVDQVNQLIHNDIKHIDQDPPAGVAEQVAKQMVGAMGANITGTVGEEEGASTAVAGPTPEAEAATEQANADVATQKQVAASEAAAIEAEEERPAAAESSQFNGPLIVYAGMTCGKSSAREAIQKHTGLRVYDTDDLTDTVVAKLKSEGAIKGDKPWRDPEQVDTWNSAFAEAVKQKQTDQDVILTNVPVGFERFDAAFVKIPDEVMALQAKRGGSVVPREVIEGYYGPEGIEQITGQVGRKVEVLPQGEYLLDRLKPLLEQRGASWR